MPNITTSSAERHLASKAAIKRKKARSKGSVTTPPPIRGPPISPQAFSISEFCIAHRISVAMYYKMRSLGLGPDEMPVGKRRIISAEAAARWRAERETATAEVESAARSP